MASSTMMKNAGDSLGFMEFTVYWRGQYRKIRWSRAGEEAAALIHIMADAEGLH